jgi:hypothetical protein
MASGASAQSAVDGGGPRALSTVDPSVVGSYHLQMWHSGKCIQDPGVSTANIQLDQYTCVNQSNVEWYLDPVSVGSNQFWRIRNVASNKCMNVDGGSVNNGAPIIQYPCGAYDNEYFIIWSDENVAPGYYWIQAHSSGKVLNIAGASTANGGKLIQYTRGYYGNEYVALNQDPCTTGPCPSNVG